MFDVPSVYRRPLRSHVERKYLYDKYLPYLFKNFTIPYVGRWSFRSALATEGILKSPLTYSISMKVFSLANIFNAFFLQKPFVFSSLWENCKIFLVHRSFMSVEEFMVFRSSVNCLVISHLKYLQDLISMDCLQGIFSMKHLLGPLFSENIWNLLHVNRGPQSSHLNILLPIIFVYGVFNLMDLHLVQKWHARQHLKKKYTPTTCC